MKILAIAGTHPRHLYYFNAIHREFGLAGAIFEERGAMIPAPPAGIAEPDRKNFVRHFKKRDEAEKRYFGNQVFPAGLSLRVNGGNLNGPASVKFVERIRPDLVLVYGSLMIREPLFSKLPQHTINLHSGLSPRYRGSATLFWPFYFMEPTYAGCTFHYIVSEPDAGEIIHQVTPPLDKNDGIHDVGAKAIVSATAEMLKLLKIFQTAGEWQTYAQKGSGKNFLQKDFRPEHLRVNYDLFNDEMIRYYLEGKLNCSQPSLLVRQFNN